MSEIRENEVKVWTVAVGNLPVPPFIPKKSKEAIKYISKLEGFVGFHPVPPHGTLCLFKTENDAKGGRNHMRAKGIQVGKNIGYVFIDKSYLRD